MKKKPNLTERSKRRAFVSACRRETVEEILERWRKRSDSDGLEVSLTSIRGADPYGVKLIVSVPEEISALRYVSFYAYDATLRNAIFGALKAWRDAA